jgi:hypothetical protein
MVGRGMTVGEKIVGVDFNPGGHAQVTKLKDLFSQIIDIVVNSSPSKSTEGVLVREQAIGQALAAQMMAVKSVTFKY